MIREKSVSESETERSASPELCYEYASRFLNDNERTELFEVLVSLLKSKPISSLTPERQVAKMLGISDTIVYEWKRKVKIPSPKNTAKILTAIMKCDPEKVNPHLAALCDKLMDNVLKTYVLLLDKEFSGVVRYRNVRDLALKYIPALTTILLYNVGFEYPEPFPYRRLGVNQGFKLKLINEKYLLYLYNSIGAIRPLVDKAQAIYDDYVSGT